MVMDRQKVKTCSEFQRYRMADRLDSQRRQNGRQARQSTQAEWQTGSTVNAGRMVRQVGVESRKTGKGQNRED
jgi:hypothetical protein